METPLTIEAAQEEIDRLKEENRHLKFQVEKLAYLVEIGDRGKALAATYLADWKQIHTARIALNDVVKSMMKAHRAQLPSETADLYGGGCGCPLCEKGRAALKLAWGIE